MRMVNVEVRGDDFLSGIRCDRLCVTQGRSVRSKESIDRIYKTSHSFREIPACFNNANKNSELISLSWGFGKINHRPSVCNIFSWRFPENGPVKPHCFKYRINFRRLIGAIVGTMQPPLHHSFQQTQNSNHRSLE